MLPRDCTRCADGPGNCPRADECARTQWPSEQYISTADLYFWLCSHERYAMFIAKEDADKTRAP